MGTLDTVIKEFLSNPRTFAAAFNMKMFNGKEILKAENLKPLNVDEFAKIADQKGNVLAIERTRDIFMESVVKTDDNAVYELHFGIEAQSECDPTMPLRVMLYDVLDYVAQVRVIKRMHEERGDKVSDGGKFMSGFYKGDKLKPVITLVVFFSEDAWDAPTNLTDMFCEVPEALKPFVQDYKCFVLSPRELPDFENSTLMTSLAAVLYMIKHKNDKEGMKRLAQHETFRHLPLDAAMVISKVTNRKLKIQETEGEINMWKALDDIEADGIAKGIAKGRAEGEARGEARGRAEGEERVQRSTAFNLRRMGSNESFISQAIGVAEPVIRKWFAEGQSAAAL